MIIDVSQFDPGLPQILVRLSTVFMRSSILYISNCSSTSLLYLLTDVGRLVTSHLPARQSILWRCSPIMDLVGTSITQVLWLSGLFMNGSMQKFVTSISWGPVSSIYGVFSIDVRGEGNVTPALGGEFHQAYSFSL